MCGNCSGLSHVWNQPTREPVEFPDHHYVLAIYTCVCQCGCVASMTMVDEWPLEDEDTVSIAREVMDQVLATTSDPDTAGDQS